MNRGFGAGPDASLERPLRWLAVLLVAVFGVFGLRIVQLQIIEGESLALRSERNSVRTVRVEAPRGDILERDGEVLATSRPAFGLQLIPSELRQPDLTYTVLGRLLALDPQSLRARVGSPRGRARYQPVRLAADLAFPELARVETHRYALPGVMTDVRPRRHYLEGPASAHVLGTIGEVTADQLSTRAFAGYRAGEVVGQSGVEALLEETLRGRAGGRNVVVDVSGREVEVLDEVDPVRGGTVVLTLDLDLQRAAVEAFRRDPDEPAVPAGAIVALDPRNGDVLALVSHPSYDPNHFAAGIDAETWRRLRDDPWKPLQNRAVGGQYPPGSTYKALVAAAALEEGVIGPDDRFFCPGHFRLGRRVYRCWKRPGHGWMDLRDALKHSCDVFFYNVGVKLGIDRLARHARGFGLGSPSGGPFPDERAGLVPTRAWKERRFGEPWVEGETVSAAIGQGFNLVTPLQLAVAFAAVANGGRVVEPRLVLARFDREGALVEQPEPGEGDRVPVEAAHLARVAEALEAVVMEPRGTGGRARVPGARVAGKTGTAQKLDPQTGRYSTNRYHAWFVGIVPADEPRLVIVAELDEPRAGLHHGGTSAAPLFAEVASAQLARLGIGTEPLRRGGEEAPVAVASAPVTPTARPQLERLTRDGDRVFLPDFRGLTPAEVRSITDGTSLAVELIGRGRAIDQEPDPGSIVAGGGQRVRIRFAPDAPDGEEG